MNKKDMLLLTAVNLAAWAFIILAVFGLCRLIWG